MWTTIVVLRPWAEVDRVAADAHQQPHALIIGKAAETELARPFGNDRITRQDQAIGQGRVVITGKPRRVAVGARRRVSAESLLSRLFQLKPSVWSRPNVSRSLRPKVPARFIATDVRA